MKKLIFKISFGIFIGAFFIIISFNNSLFAQTDEEIVVEGERSTTTTGAWSETEFWYYVNEFKNGNSLDCLFLNNCNKKTPPLPPNGGEKKDDPCAELATAVWEATEEVANNYTNKQTALVTIAQEVAGGIDMVVQGINDAEHMVEIGDRGLNDLNNLDDKLRDHIRAMAEVWDQIALAKAVAALEECREKND